MEVVDGGSVTTPAGFQAGGVACGVKQASDALDLGVLVSDAPAVVAGVFTQNTAPSASVLVNRERVERMTRGVVVNSGNANAATGLQGISDAKEMAKHLALRLGIDEKEALACSTGVIGVPLPMVKIERGIANIQLSIDGGHDFARAIMTTDTRAKEIAVRVAVDDRVVTIGGCAKGAGMIHPNMATMLAFVTTDAAVDVHWLAGALRRAADRSFNMIDIDGDSSTNDTVLVFANGAAGNRPIEGGAGGIAFEEGLIAVCQHLAKSIVRDAEGGSKLIEVAVSGGDSEYQARRIARAIAQSLMVKTAVHGNDPNWGRIVAAAGNAGVPFDVASTSIAIGGVPVFTVGKPVQYDQQAAVSHLRGDTITLSVSLGAGDAAATAWGCNLSEEYVTLNSVYTT